MSSLQHALQHWPQHIRDSIEEAIEDSRSILDLEDDWDGEGSPAYAEDTWNRAIEFLIGNAQRLKNIWGIWIAAPSISPGPDGSIDLHWKTESRELLINIPADLNQPAGFYGDDNEKHRVKGTLEPSGRNEWLLMWLMN